MDELEVEVLKNSKRFTFFGGGGKLFKNKLRNLWMTLF